MFLLSFLLASLYGLVFFLFSRRDWLGLVVYWLVALVGFALGQSASSVLGTSVLPIGQVNVVEGSLASVLALLILRVLWRGT
jgi:hypothetical protein